MCHILSTHRSPLWKSSGEVIVDVARPNVVPFALVQLTPNPAILSNHQRCSIENIKWSNIHFFTQFPSWHMQHPSVLAGKWKGGNEVGQANAEDSTQIKDSLPHSTFIQYINTITPKESSFLANFRCEVLRRRSSINCHLGMEKFFFCSRLHSSGRERSPT